MSTTVAEQARTQSALRAYYEEWPQLRCSNDFCEYSKQKHFGGFPSMVNMVCPLCAKRDPRNQIVGVGGFLQRVPIEELVPDFAERPA